MIKKILTGIIITSVCCTFLPQVVLPSEETGKENIYAWSDYYSEAVNDGVWTNEYYDVKTKSYKAADTQREIAYFSADQKSRALAWTPPDANSAWPAGVSAYWMRAGYDTSDSQQYAVKTFTAPSGGNIEIGGSVGTDVSDPNGNIKIMHNDIQLWPRPGSYEGVEAHPETADTYQVGNSTLYFKPEEITAKVEPGDKIRFIVLNGRRNTGSTNWALTKVHMMPEICYTVNKEYPSYKASDSYYSYVNGDEYWKWQYYSPSEGYCDLKSHITYISGFSADGTQNGEGWIRDNSLGEAVGKYFMRPNVEGDKNTYKAVRTFTVPYTGTIEISASDANGKNYICNYSESQSAYLRVKWNDKKIWPKTEGIEGVLLKEDKIPFEHLQLDVKKGDKIYFEAYIGNITWNYYSKKVYWDPVIIYTHMPNVIESITFSDGDGKLLSEFDEIVDCHEVKVKAEVSAVDEMIDSAVMLAAIYDDEGRLRGAGISEKKEIALKCSEEFNINLSPRGFIKDGELKVFVFNDINGIMPLKLKNNALIPASKYEYMPEISIGEETVPWSGKIISDVPISVGEKYAAAGEVCDIKSGEEVKSRFNAGKIKYVRLKDDNISFSVPVKNEGGVIYLPANDFFRKSGAKLEGDIRLVGSYNGAETVIEKGKNIAWYDEVNLELDAEVTDDGTETWIPLNYFSSLYGTDITVSGDKADVSVCVRKPKIKIKAEDILQKYTPDGTVLGKDSFCKLPEISGSKYDVSYQTVSEKEFDKALRIKTKVRPEIVYAYQLVMKNTGKIKYGDTCVLTFWGRMIDTTEDDGLGYVNFRFDNSDSENKVHLGHEISLSDKWEKFTLPFTALSDIEIGHAAMRIRFGYKPQTIEIAALEIKNYGSKVSVKELIPEYANDTYKGREEDALWRKEALKRIEKYRKGNLNVFVKDSNGNPINGADVSVDMTENEFMFGTAVNAYFMRVDKFASDKYQKILNENFNAIVAESHMKMGQNSDDADYVYNYAKEHGMRMRGHTLVWDETPHYTSDVLNEITQSGVKSRIDEFISDMSTRYGDCVHWDVLNEPTYNMYYRTRYGYSFAADWFKTFRNVNSFSKAYVNECTYAGKESQNPSVDKITKIVEELRANGAEIDGIGVQCHAGGVDIYPQTLYNQLEQTGEHANELCITEYDYKAIYDNNSVTESQTTQLEADVLRDYLIAAYSHPKVTGFFMWGFGARGHWRGTAPLCDIDYNPTPGMNVWKQLVLNDWTTNENTVTDNNGKCSVRGFRGKYSLTVSTNGKKAVISTVIKDGENNVTVIID